ncbi:hypothetical protein [uncultured Campylobacter sp.]|uniref:hypothetical protein n=1 Tax=uncultured Campylobacter sp. TaxID=218934 RepID=UPI00260AF448|nr:hypothetical protein [uncultured Campylobacter sp.]
MKKILLSFSLLAFLSSNLFAWGFPTTNPNQDYIMAQKIILNCRNTQANGTIQQKLYARNLCLQYGVDTMSDIP